MPRVLLVDDEAALRESLTYTLQKEGYQVIAATDGREAIKQFYKEVPDIVILDLMLPEVGGMEIGWRIRAFSKVPIVVDFTRARSEDLKNWTGALSESAADALAQGDIDRPASSNPSAAVTSR